MKSRETELRVGVEAVRAASRICRQVQERLVGEDTLEKKDKSPVTVADFASQAVVCQRLAQEFPDDRVVGEEAADELRHDENATLRSTVVEQVRGETEASAPADQVLSWIDRGGAKAEGERYWTLDPIDGTKGFLRGEQYAVALALIEDGRVVLGLLGCPNLPVAGGTGALFAAAEGAPTRLLPLWEKGEGTTVSVQSVSSPAEARFCESVESGHSDQGSSARIAELLGIESEPFRIDSQCKYGAVARGDTSIYLRMPTRKD